MTVVIIFCTFSFFFVPYATEKVVQPHRLEHPEFNVFHGLIASVYIILLGFAFFGVGTYIVGLPELSKMSLEVITAGMVGCIVTIGILFMVLKARSFRKSLESSGVIKTRYEG